MDPLTITLCGESIVNEYGASGCRSVADFLSSPTFLRLISTQNVQGRVYLSSVSVMPLEGGINFFAPALRENEEKREAGSFLRFLRALPTSSCSSCSLGYDVFESLEELAALCDGIASPLCSLSELQLRWFIKNIAKAATSAPDDQRQDGISATPESLISDALLKNTSLHSLSLLLPASVNYDQVLCPVLIARSPSSCPITHLKLDNGLISGVDIANQNLHDRANQILLAVANNTIALTGLRIFSGFARKGSDERLLDTIVQTNTSLRSLGLEDMDLEREVVETLFTSLPKNAHLTSLSLAHSWGSDWPSVRLVLDSLRANGLLTHLDLRRTPYSGSNTAAIKAQLERNKKERELLQAHGLSQVEPSNVRLFLCGLPYSGKTTLSRSLVRWTSSKSTFSSITRHLPSSTRKSIRERTRGIEVSTLQNGRLKVSLWDMAGQAHYYAFHDCMFPNLSNDSTPSLLLFVWSPIRIDTSTGQYVEDGNGDSMIKTSNMFNQEFRYWLKFIASKTLKSLNFRPRLLVVVTRADLLDFSIKSLINNVFNECRNDFEEYIQFDMEGLFEMDARDPHEVGALACAIFDCAASVLNPMPKVYALCELARDKFASLLHARSIAPLMTKSKFTLLCKKHLGIDKIEVEEAVALSLNDSGDLIYFKSLELVVVDTQWFCNRIMGDLLHFAAKKYEHKGFFSIEFLGKLLEYKVNSKGGHSKSSWFGRTKRTDVPKVEGEALVKLLIGLGLACQWDDTSEIFIPASLSTRSSTRVHPNVFFQRGEASTNLTFMGRRLKCRNSVCTFLTPGIFSFLQVTFNTGAEATLEEDIIALHRDGVKVLIEFCKFAGQDHFIDILVHSCLDLDKTIEWVYGEVIDKVEKVCAEPRGIQGVELVQEVIRPGCVRETVQERNAAVPMERLRNALSNHLDRKGPQPDLLKSVFHSWPSKGDSDCVVDLFGKQETLKIVTAYKQKFISDVEDVLGINIEKEANCSPIGPDKQLVFSTSVSGKEREGIYEAVQGLHKDFQVMHKDIQNIGEYMQKICESWLPTLMQSMQEQLTYFKERDTASLPRMFVVTRNDTGRMRKIVGALMPSLKNVQLELLCEYHSQPHLVEERNGLNFETMEDGLLKQGLPYINKFLRLAVVVMKVGASVAAGLGDAVPDFSRVLATVVDAPQFPIPPATPQSSAHMSRLDVQHGQRWLGEVLSKHNCCSDEEIHRVFGLSRVQYGDSHVGWLCDSHSSEGQLCHI